MSKENERRMEAAKEAIQKVFEDESVSQDECRTNLEELMDFVKDYQNSLDEETERARPRN
jgi:ribosome recycling factor